MLKYNHNIATLSMLFNIPYNTMNYNKSDFKIIKKNYTNNFKKINRYRYNNQNRPKIR